MKHIYLSLIGTIMNTQQPAQSWRSLAARSDLEDDWCFGGLSTSPRGGGVAIPGAGGPVFLLGEYLTSQTL